jgi:hypothetical protein
MKPRRRKYSRFSKKEMQSSKLSIFCNSLVKWKNTPNRLTRLKVIVTIKKKTKELQE